MYIHTKCDYCGTYHDLSKCPNCGSNNKGHYVNIKQYSYVPKPTKKYSPPATSDKILLLLVLVLISTFIFGMEFLKNMLF